MKQRIWKFPLVLVTRQQISMPKPVHLLTVQVQNGIPTLWAIVDPDAKTVAVNVLCVGTGQAMEPHIEYLGTTQLNGFVWHWFGS